MILSGSFGNMMKNKNKEIVFLINDFLLVSKLNIILNTDVGYCVVYFLLYMHSGGYCCSVHGDPISDIMSNK